MKIHKSKSTAAPSHLSKRAREFWDSLTEVYVFESQDLERLRVACESLDNVDECAAAIKKDGVVVKDRWGQQKPHPAFQIARDARQLLLRALRELNVDVEAPAESRVPRQNRRYG